MINDNTTVIIEDNPGDLLLLEHQLKSAGWNEETTSNVLLSDAIETLRTCKPAIVFLDLNLPDSNGLETFLTIQQVAPEVPIIILSGLSDASLSVQAVQAGAQDYLVKGEFEEKLLLKTILYSIERKKIQLKLQESNERFAYAAKATNDALWDWDMDTNTILWNEKVKVFGYHDAVTKNESWRLSNIHPDDKQTFTAMMDELLLNKKDQWELQYRFRCANGTYKYIYDRGYILRSQQKKPYRMIGTMQDITSQVLLQKKLENEKEKKQKAILKATIEGQEKERNEIGKELHDNVNQILASAGMHLALVKAGNEARMLELVETSKFLINKAVDEIRILAHSMVSTHIINLGLHAVLDEFIKNLKKLGLFNIHVNTNIATIQIPTGIALTIYRIIQEHFNNIIKHAAAGNVYLNLLADDDVIQLTLTDDGKGISDEKINTGIGLSNIHNRATGYNGSVQLLSEPGKGFTITVSLPLKVTDEE